MNSRQYKLIDDAYIKMQVALQKDVKLKPRADAAWAEFLDAILAWGNDQGKGIEFVMDYLGGRDLDAIAGIGQGAVFMPNFKLFMQSNETRNMLVSLFELRLGMEENLDRHQREEAVDYIFSQANLISQLIKYEFPSRGNPEVLTARFLIMLFDNLFTTVALRSDLEKVYDLIDPGTGKSFFYRQYGVRQLTDEYLTMNNLLNDKTRWEKAALAWWIK